MMAEELELNEPNPIQTRPINIPIIRTTRVDDKDSGQAYSDSQVIKINHTSHSTDCRRHSSDPGQRLCKNSELPPKKKQTLSPFKIDNKWIRRRSAPECKNAFYPPDTNISSHSVTAALLLAHQTIKLSCPVVTVELTPPLLPAPLVVEDPPSSDNVSDLDEDTVKHNVDPVLLNGVRTMISTSTAEAIAKSTKDCLAVINQNIGVPIPSIKEPRQENDESRSSSNFGSAGPRSAPSTPQGLHGPAVGLSLEPHSQPASPSYNTTNIPKSPSHVFGKYDKGALKQLSSSAPIMTAQARSPEPPSPKGAKGEKMPTGSSKARQKKFHRHFAQVDDDEKVLNYYSCALVGDILLQGHLYITKNYFAFYSNVFGYVTKLLIPIASVLKISKERTAKIIPNAIGVATAEDKHVFGSLLSRDSTYKLMMLVLKTANSEPVEDTLPVIEDVRPEELLDPSEYSVEDESSSQSGNDSPAVGGTRPYHRTRVKPHPGIVPTITKISPESSVDGGTVLGSVPLLADIAEQPTRRGLRSLPRYNVFLLVSTLLLLGLFTSAAFMLYRISRIQIKYSLGLQESLGNPNSEIYNEILHWQSQLHSKSAGAVHNFLDSNLDQIAKVRRSLEALSTLLTPTQTARSQAQEAEHRTESPPEAANTPNRAGGVQDNTAS